MALAWLPASAQAPDSAGGGTAADQDPVRAFGAANRLYEAGRFSEAAQAYQAIVDRGFESASLNFNLGNACLKSGELGEAVVAYERARALAPRDDDIRENLERARSLAVDVVPEPSGSIFLAKLAALKDWLSPGEALTAASLGLWLALATAAATRLVSRGRRWVQAAAWISFGLLILTSTLAAIQVA
ncbi:MAG TPA: tetratricopeptide repeat protein, partial [Candidatus Udaeobacter sp.]|nr:tetratricopeptide repeat protein [Candidatus Udaeobacter sp.]